MKALNYLLLMPKVATGPSEGLFSIGIAYISSYLKQEGYNIFPLNLNFCQDIKETLTHHIRDHHIDAVMVGGLSGQFHTVKEIVDIVDGIDSSIIKVVGGGVMTSQPDVAIRAFEHVDIGVIGEGEFTCADLCGCLDNNLDLHDVSGIIYQNDAKDWIITPDRCDVPNLDVLPFPDYDGFDFGSHINTSVDVKESYTNQLRNVYLIGSRSCPYPCTFCFHSSGKRYRKRSLDNIFAELDYLKETYDIKSISFQDELFSAKKDRLMEFCRRIKSYNINWFCSLRINTIDDEILTAVKESGCSLVGVGLESAHDTVLESMQKHITLEQIDTGLQKIYNHGIPFAGNFIFGDSAETKETAEFTLNWWKEHAYYNIALALVIPFPGSALFREAVKKGIITDPVKYLRDGCPQINVSQMDDEEFGEIGQKILQYPLEVAPRLSNYTYKDKKLTGKCSHCHQSAQYDITFFETLFVICKNCGQKHYVFVDQENTDLIIQKIAKITPKGKIAFWGIYPSLFNFLTKNSFFDNPNVFFIDNSKVRQMSKIHQRQISNPDIIAEQKVDYVLTGIPGIVPTIEKQIANNYPTVKEIITLGSLVE